MFVFVHHRPDDGLPDTDLAEIAPEYEIVRLDPIKRGAPQLSDFDWATLREKEAGQSP